MKTSSVSNLKARLSEMLRSVKEGEEVVVLEHKRPIARITRHSGDAMIVREATAGYEPGRLEPLTTTDPMSSLEEERAERW
jgi:antitoxin (DNA-binding transcriptional repressor) of toxin-antitoxin stability system